MSLTPAQQRYRLFAWINLAYMVAVILWGTFVRATGSGAGCGEHWPLCNGEVLPRAKALETVIEFTHRTTSGLIGFLLLIQLAFAFVLYSKGSWIRKAAVASTFLVLTEGAVGALLVKKGLVANNASLDRAIVVSLHLINTFLLVAAQTLTAWYASGRKAPDFSKKSRTLWILGIGIFGLLWVGSTGAVTALGDTLFPPKSLSEGFAQDFDLASHFLVRLRVWHPVFAACTTAYLFFMGFFAIPKDAPEKTKQLGATVSLLAGSQLLVGFINITLLAPTWMQLTHLFLADVIWITAIIFSASALGDTVEQPSSVADAVGVAGE